MNDNFNNGRIFCTQCGAPNRAGYRFCVRCGAKLMVLASSPEPEISNELLQTEPVRSEPVTFEPEPAAHEPEPAAYEPEPKTEKLDMAAQTFGVFEEPTQQEEPVAFE
ncbi:MAG: zinc ribbon domain-containing protein, partial [Lachnospiraceae bacterium]|nr:zinc ribbon domain-containing protein [Lachnospiraceae bacterium]